MSFRKFRFITAICIVTLLTLFSLAQAQLSGDAPAKLGIELVRLNETTQKECNLPTALMAVVSISPDEGWKTYAHEPGELGKPTTVTVRVLGQDIPLGSLYPPGTPEPDVFDPSVISNVYHGTARVFVPLPQDLAPPFTLDITADFLLCSKTSCVPVTKAISHEYKSLSPSSLVQARDQDWFPQLKAAATPKVQEKQPEPFEPVFYQSSLEVTNVLSALLFGLLAGFLLNFMPCVLPVISLKFSAFLSGSAIEDATERRKSFREHNIFFAAGILSYFTFLAGLLAATGLAWGELFQQPAVSLGLVALVFAMGLSLSGVFHLPVIDLKLDSGGGSPKRQAFFTGVLATLLATPCSGPFLGGVLGWALVQPAHIIWTVFWSIGLGMALPYLLFILFPGLASRIPRPGSWTGVVEKVVAFFLFGTCIYLLNILPTAKLMPALVMLWAVALGCWMWGLAQNSDTKARELILKGISLFLIAFSLGLTMQREAPTPEWRPYTQAALQDELLSGPVLVDFTADWCPSCKALEATVLTPGNLKKWEKEYGLRYVVADLTENNPEAEAMLEKLRAKSIPVVAIFSQDKPDNPVVLRDLFTTGQLEEALEWALSSKKTK